MRKIIFSLLFLPIFCCAQNANVFIKILDAKGQQINGESVTKGFEKWIQATSTGSAAKNNTTFNFTMPVGGASADLKKAMAADEFLMKAEVAAVAPSSYTGLLVYTIKMEQVKVLSCSESMGCNNVMNTTVSLQATRISWTYYTQGRTGATTVSRKFGWDAEKQIEWINF